MQINDLSYLESCRMVLAEFAWMRRLGRWALNGTLSCTPRLSDLQTLLPFGRGDETR